MDWFDNEKLFFEQLEIGHTWSEYVAKCLNEVGVPCYATKMEKRKNIHDRHRFRNERDVVLTRYEGWLEVKANTYEFDWDPQSFPWNRPFVDTALGWSRKDPKPIAVCLVSQKTGAIIAIPAKTEPSWQTVTKYDRIRGIEETFLTVSKGDIRTFSELVEWIKRRQSSGDVTLPTSAQGSGGSV